MEIIVIIHCVEKDKNGVIKNITYEASWEEEPTYYTGLPSGIIKSIKEHLVNYIKLKEECDIDIKVKTLNGDKVYLVYGEDSRNYLRTDNNHIEEDNLENVDECEEFLINNRK